LHLISVADVVQHEFCITESFRAECGQNEVLMIDKALFGRMSLGRCVTRDFGHIGCSADVHKQVITIHFIIKVKVKVFINSKISLTT
jgi:hypothetical protein